MNIDAKIAKYLFGADVVGEGYVGYAGDDGSPMVKKSSEQFGDFRPLMVDHCMPEMHSADHQCTDPEDIVLGHHRYCLTAVPEYSRDHAYVGQILKALSKRGYLADMLYSHYADEDASNDAYVCLSSGELDDSYRGEGESLPLALCKAALKALGVE